MCPTHGEFKQTPNNHLQGCGCQKCGFEKCHKKKYNTESWIQKAKTVHGDKYDYSKVNYVSPYEPISIICPIHGEFKEKPNDHLSGNGCKKCGYEKVSSKLSLGRDLFIKHAREIHGNKYDYSKVEYISNKKDVCVICPKHGEFLTKPFNHIINKSGCPICNSSKLEESVMSLLKEHSIDFEMQKEFDWLINDRTKCKLKMDFYVPKYNIVVECQGEQHLKPIAFGSTDVDEVRRKFENVIHKDKLKNSLCKKNGIKLLYIVDKVFYETALEFEIYDEDNIFYDLNKLVDEIKKVENN